MLFLKQSTASQTVLIGPFVDDTDGATAETGLTIANTDIRLSKNGGNLAAKNSGGGTHDEAGWYQITLDATDTNTVGTLQLHVKVSGALMVHAEFHVLEEDIYDALIGASAAGFDSNQRVDVGSWLGTAVTLGSGAPDVNIASTDDIDLSATQKASVNAECDTALTDYDAVVPGDLPTNFADLSITATTGRVDVASIEGSDATDQINAACDTAIETYGLDHLISASVTGTDIADNSIVASLVSSQATADWDDFVNTTDSLQAIRDHIGDGTNLTEAGGDGDHLTESGGTGDQLTAITDDTGLLSSAHSEPTGVPAANETPLDKIGYIFMALRNKVTVTSSKKQFFDDGGAAEFEKDLSDDGTTYSESEANAP